MKKIRVSLGKRSYNILIGRGLLKSCGRIIRGLRVGNDAVIITNARLMGLYGKALKTSIERSGMTARFETVPDSEKAKSGIIAMRLIDKISSYDKRRTLFIIAFGGGVIGDLAGFVAATYKRGIPYIQIPTTLLAQVDSAIGGKVAVDLPAAKNLIGAFYQPRAVISDVSLVGSLPKRQVASGLSEIIKYGVIKDSRLFRYLEKNYKQVLKLDPRALEFVIARSSEIKAAIVEKDEFDKSGHRAILNYGHTIGHAVEAASGYSSRYSHGEAVAIGMVAACRIAKLMGMVKESDCSRINALIEKAGLPTSARGIGFKDIRRAYILDKKFTKGKNRLVLPEEIGAVKVVDNVPDELIKKAMVAK